MSTGVMTHMVTERYSLIFTGLLIIALMLVTPAGAAVIPSGFLMPGALIPAPGDGVPAMEPGVFPFTAASGISGQSGMTLTGQGGPGNSDIIDKKLTPGEAAALKALVRNTLAAFSCDPTTGTCTARNAANRSVFSYTAEGAACFSDPKNTFRLTLAGIGREGSITPAGRGVVQASGRELTITRPGYTEWYRNDDTGVEQGVTLRNSPPGTGPLQVTFRYAGEGTISSSDGRSVTVTNAGGSPAFVYTGLRAFSTDGRELPASLATDGAMLSWIIDDAGAVYPVTIDPVVIPASAAAKTFTGGAPVDVFGRTVSLSSDGSYVLIGASQNDTVGANAGAAYLFVKPAGGWSGTTSASAATATFLGAAAGDQLGTSVSLSSDGSRALIGARNNDTAGANAGAAYIFDKPPGGWSGTTSASAATATFLGGAASDDFGIYVSLSSDGSRALIGADYNCTSFTDAGAAYLFDKPPGGWSGTKSASAATATFLGGATSDRFGGSVSLSPDGSRALIGAAYNDTAGADAGATYIFDKPGGGWSGTTSASAATATFPGGAAGDEFGKSVSLSSDGSRALIGAINNDTVGADAGAAYIFDKPPGGWSGTTSASAATATFTAGAAGDQFGTSVSLSSDGSRALIGAGTNDTAGADAGAAYIFDKPSGGWSGITSASAAATTFLGGAAGDLFGIVSLSPDGSRALIGAIYNDTAGSNAGAAYLFQSPFTTLTAGGTTSGAAGASVNGLTLNPSGTLTNIDLYLGTDASTTTGTAIKTGIATLPASTATTVDGVSLAGKSAGSYYLITCGAGTTTILSATGSAAYTVTGSPPVTTAPASSTGGTDSSGPAPASTQTVPTSTVSVNVGGNTPVTSVVVTGTGNSGIIVTATEVPASGLGEQPPQSIVYKCLEITPARYGTITGAVITFTVPQSWLEEHRLTPKDIVLYHIVGKEWQALPTTVVKTANGQVYFSAASSGFSRFVIAGITSGSIQTTVTLDPAGVQTSGNVTGVSNPGSSVTPGQAPVQSPVVARTTAAPPAPAAPDTGIPLATIALIGAGCIVLLGAGGYMRRWWIRQQNPALFKENE